MQNKISVSRKTTESQMCVTLDFNGVGTDYRSKIQTPLPFLSHMIEHIAYRSNIGIETQVSLGQFSLTHVVCEDLGQTMGRAFAAYLDAATDRGMAGYGAGVGIIDEAFCQAAVSFEKRAYFSFTHDGISLPEQAEGMETADLTTFLEGFCQGAQCTLHVDIQKGENPHHIFEAAFRAVGICLGDAFLLRDSRIGKTAGVAGAVNFEVHLEK